MIITTAPDGTVTRSESTPLEILMAIHYLTRPTPYAEYEPEHRNSRMVAKITASFLARGYIRPVSGELAASGPGNKFGQEFEPTGALRVWVDALCAVPKPRRVERWEIPEA